jgi:Zn-dependent protease
LRPFAWFVLLITSVAAMSALESHRWMLGWAGAALFILALVFAAILIHELAHAVAAVAVGARVSRIVVVPFEFTLRPRRLRLIRRPVRGDLGGYVSYTLDRIEARKRHAIVAVAGPFANIVTGLAAGGVHAGGVQLLDGVGGLPAESAVATAFAILSVGMGLANLIPFDGSDGTRLLRYFRPVRR